jgi:YD repeat-containing protein
VGRSFPFTALLLLAAAPRARAQEPDLDGPQLEVVERSEPLGPVRRRALDGGVEGHLGWGTLEDLFVDVGAGGALSLLSGNVVLRVVPLPRGDLPPDSVGAFTWNSEDADGMPEVGRGWSLDVLRRVLPGAWGERILVDGDGFRDAFVTGPPPDEKELLRLREDLLDRWRRATRPAERRAVGGVEGLRLLLEEDPMALAALRLRFLGPPSETPGDQEARSPLRGERRLLERGRAWTLRRADGGLEEYGEDGMLSMVDAQGVAPLRLVRENGVVQRLTLGEAPLFRWSWDGSGRVLTLQESTGRSARVVRADRQIHKIEGAPGTWRFAWDGAGRITAMEGPDGVVEIEWRADGTVARLEGPWARVEVDPGSITQGRVRRVVRGLPGGPWTVEWDEGARQRVVRGARGTERVDWDGERPLPVRVEDAGGVVVLGWSAAGRLLQVERGTHRLRIDRRLDGSPTALDVGGGRRLTVQMTELGRVQLRDGAGRTEVLDVSDDGSPLGLTTPGGARVTLRRSFQGAVLGAELLGGAGTGQRLDMAGALRSIDLELGGSALLRRDGQGRWAGAEAPDGAGVVWDTGPGGRVEVARARGMELRLRFDDDGALVGWSGARGTFELRRGEGGEALELAGPGGAVWQLERDPRGRVRRIRRADGADIAIDRDGEGRILGWSRPGGGHRAFRWGERGRVVGIEDDAEGDLGFERGLGGDVEGVRRGGGSWRIERDGAGQVVGVADAGGGAHRLLRGAGGRVERVILESLPPIDLERDAPGRLVGVVGDGVRWAARRGRHGKVEEMRVTDEAGADLRPPVRLRWSRRAGLDELARGEERWPVPARPPPDPAAFLRDGMGRPLELGGLRVTWGPSGWTRIGTDEVAVLEVERDAVGRIVAFQGVGGVRWDIGRDAWGEAERLIQHAEAGARQATVGRDAAGRVSWVELDGRRVEVGRGPHGRVRSLRWGIAAVDVHWLDEERPGDDGLALALGVSEPEPRSPLGSRTVKLRAGSAGALEVEERWGPLGRPVRVRAPGAPDLLLGGDGAGGSSPLDGGAGGADLIGLGGWVGTCGAEVPSGWSGGGLWAGGDRVAVPHGGGGVLTWLGLDGSVNGLGLPGADGESHTPKGWLAPSPACAAPPRSQGILALVRQVLGSARAMWDGDGLPAVDTAPHPGVGPRTGIWLRDGGLPDGAERGGEGAMLPPVPGASRLVPRDPAVEPADGLLALVAVGDLPMAAADLRVVLPMPGPTQMLDVPALGLLLDLQARRRNAAVPPWEARAGSWRWGPGLQSVAWGPARRLAVEPAVGGLPPGTRDLLPGADGTPLPGLIVLPGDQRRTAWDRLGGDPLGVGEAALAAAEQDRILLATQALDPPPPSALSGGFDLGLTGERWVVEVAPGLRLVVDGRGRPVGVDLGGRLRAARDGWDLDHAGAVLLAEVEGPPGPAPWAAESGGAVEARWGLVPGEPRLPVDANGQIGVMRE